MRISKIIIPESVTKEVNLKKIDLTKKNLGSTVALVGKNGAGKSRILKIVEEYIKTITYENFLNDYLIYTPKPIIDQYTKTIDSAKLMYSQIKKGTSQITNTRTNVEGFMSQFMQRLHTLGQAYVKVVDQDDLNTIKDSITKSNNISFEGLLMNSHFDNIVANQNTLQKAFSTPNPDVLTNEFKALNSMSTINYITKLANDIIAEEFSLYIQNREQPQVINEQILKKDSYQLFEKFKGYVNKFLGKELSFQPIKSNTSSCKLYFDGEPFNLKLFSPGQRTLFAYAVLFYYMDINSKSNIGDSIIIIDEPEMHLHPEAQIALINALKSIVNEKGQLWIATHSVHILSHLEYDEIIMIKDNEIIPPSRRTPGNSFNDLMGLDGHINELFAFIKSTSEWAFGHFLVQCFKKPEVIFGKNLDDPQFKLFKTFINEKMSIKLLDFGAGKGRIGVTIKEDETISNKIEYSAFEIDEKNLDYLKKIPNAEGIYIKAENIPENNFDCVLLCNVLHEINPKEWVKIILSIKNKLNDNGLLLIIEDRFLPKGENANEFGYLILGSEEVRILLNSKSTFELKDSNYNERIIFSAFLKSEINPSNNSLKKSLMKLNENAFNNIKSIKKEMLQKNEDLNLGRKYANETQLYINSEIAIKELFN